MVTSMILKSKLPYRFIASKKEGYKKSHLQRGQTNETTRSISFGSQGCVSGLCMNSGVVPRLLPHLHTPQFENLRSAFFKSFSPLGEGISDAFI